MSETKISWTHRPGTVGRTWNVAQGCSRKSEGCRNCYAEKTAARFAKDGWSKGLINLKTRKWSGVVRLAMHKLHEPLAWTKPSTVFANSMSDLFHEGFTNEEIAAVYGVMLAAKRHVFQVLTKRPDRRRAWYAWIAEQARHEGTTVSSKLLGYAARALEQANQSVWSSHCYEMTRNPHAFPAPNIWEGTSVENQETADERIPELLATPAAIRFLSCEPLLDAVDLHAIQIPDERGGLRFSALQRHHDDRFGQSDTTIDWVISGCESGADARECDVAWLRSLRDQCASAGVPFFLKQAVESRSSGDETAPVEWGYGSQRKQGSASIGGHVIELPYLDGEQHAAYPEVSP